MTRPVGPTSRPARNIKADVGPEIIDGVARPDEVGEGLLQLRLRRAKQLACHGAIALEAKPSPYAVANDAFPGSHASGRAPDERPEHRHAVLEPPDKAEHRRRQKTSGETSGETSEHEDDEGPADRDSTTGQPRTLVWSWQARK